MTRLYYLADSSLSQSQAHVIEVKMSEDGRCAVILDETIFYPQGGGQPADNGYIEHNGVRFIVNDVRLDQNGIVHHFGAFERGSFANGQSVSLHIDRARRIRNSKLHSAGHLIDCVVTQMGLPLKPGKGCHFPEGAYVEYEGTLEASPEFLATFQQKINALLKQNLAINTGEISEQEARERHLHVPAGKNARLVIFEGFEPCGCGGTHVQRTGELGSITVRKIKIKNGIVRISYDVA